MFGGWGWGVLKADQLSSEGRIFFFAHRINADLAHTLGVTENTKKSILSKCDVIYCTLWLSAMQGDSSAKVTSQLPVQKLMHTQSKYNETVIVFFFFLKKGLKYICKADDRLFFCTKTIKIWSGNGEFTREGLLLFEHELSPKGLSSKSRMKFTKVCTTKEPCKLYKWPQRRLPVHDMYISRSSVSPYAWRRMRAPQRAYHEPGNVYWLDKLMFREMMTPEQQQSVSSELKDSKLVMGHANPSAHRDSNLFWEVRTLCAEN